MENLWDGPKRNAGATEQINRNRNQYKIAFVDLRWGYLTQLRWYSYSRLLKFFLNLSRIVPPFAANACGSFRGRQFFPLESDFPCLAQSLFLSTSADSHYYASIPYVALHS